MAERQRNKLLISAIMLITGALIGTILSTFYITQKLAQENANSTAVSHIAEYTMGHVFIPELNQLIEKWGDPQYSRHAEELVIRDFFQDRKNGFFVDIGANDYKQENNTYYLEKHLGWRGVAVDAQANFAVGYERHRPATAFVAAFVGNRDDETVPFFIVHSDPFYRQSTGNHNSALENKHDQSKVNVISIRVNTLLDKFDIEKIDFLSMDIELSEPNALDGFDINRFKPELVCVEAHQPIWYQLQTYFAEHDYHLLGQYTRVDGRNWYFAPRKYLRRKRINELHMDIPASKNTLPIGKHNLGESRES
jgi:FkbM family methyltransferase